MKRSAKTQSVLDRYRASLSPPVATRQRVWDELAERAAAGEAPSLPTSSPPPALPAPAGLSSSPALLASALGAGALCVVAAWSWRSDHAPVATPAPARQAPASSVVGEASLDAPAPQRVEPSAATPAPQPADRSGSSPAAGERAVARRAGASARPAEPARKTSHADGAATTSVAEAARTAPSASGGASVSIPTTSGTDSSFAPFGGTPARSVPRAAALELGRVAAAPELEQELRLLRSAYTALRADRPKRALSWLDEHAARFPQGALAETRDVTRIMALCQAGERAAAHTEAARFLQRAPRSPYAERVRAVCAEAGEPR